MCSKWKYKVWSTVEVACNAFLQQVLEVVEAYQKKKLWCFDIKIKKCVLQSQAYKSVGNQPDQRLILLKVTFALPPFSIPEMAGGYSQRNKGQTSNSYAHLGAAQFKCNLVVLTTEQLPRSTLGFSVSL